MSNTILMSGIYRFEKVPAFWDLSKHAIIGLYITQFSKDYLKFCIEKHVNYLSHYYYFWVALRCLTEILGGFYHLLMFPKYL